MDKLTEATIAHAAALSALYGTLYELLRDPAVKVTAKTVTIPRHRWDQILTAIAHRMACDQDVKDAARNP